MIIVLTTYSNKKKAQGIAKEIIKQNLAACVNVIKIESSHYKWNGKFCETGEFLLVIKTANKNYKRLEKFIKKNHPYKMPEIIQLKVSGGFSAYLDWVDQAI
ncbi:Divalent-cation tolerance protein CutA [Candidatus Bilamarchaeum dharawalense]|uniref:Divalent-cation tolerance protein CutA n=1 Tax=Candidatus Bilamarchaeum dharawalense TaxID=2885759 RepID=A0A5E4LS06_9ARCH|nr:Divalent-cation tolerance protein CutA [Candidatus Bilamarchaeum dharawalense]